MRDPFSGNSRTGVLNAELYFVTNRLCTHGDATSRLSELHRVTDEISNPLHDPVLVGAYHEPSGRVDDFKRQCFLIRGIAPRSLHVVQQGCHAYVGELQ